MIVAAGLSRRFGQDKLSLSLLGQPVLWHTIRAFEICTEIHKIAVVCSREGREAVEAVVRDAGFLKVSSVCEGGLRRQDSVLAGLLALGEVEWVAIHDGARPLVTPEIIQRGLLAATATGAAIAAVPVKDTIKVVSPTGIVISTPERSTLRAIQTPQVFRRDLILAAHRRVTEDVTDDAAMAERVGASVAVFDGSYENLKITTVEDIPVAEALLRRRGD